MSVKFDGTGKKKRGGSAIYIAIGLCCAAIALVGVSAVLNNRQEQGGLADNILSQSADEWLGEEEEGEILPQEQSVAADASADAQGGEEQEISAQEQEEFFADAVEAAVTTASTAPPTTVPSETAATSSAAASTKAKKAAFRPLDGKLIKDYSGSELVFCSTMGDWRVHEGVDLAGEPGSAVHAASDGVVYDVVDDVLFGHTVIVLGEDDSMLYYCGLSSNALVSKGMEIKAGDVIGTLDVVPCEAGEAPHLHLAMMSAEGGFIDPAAVLGL